MRYPLRENEKYFGVRHTPVQIIFRYMRMARSRRYYKYLRLNAFLVINRLIPSVPATKQGIHFTTAPGDHFPTLGNPIEFVPNRFLWLQCIYSIIMKPGHVWSLGIWSQGSRRFVLSNIAADVFLFIPLYLFSFSTI